MGRLGEMDVEDALRVDVHHREFAVELHWNCNVTELAILAAGEATVGRAIVDGVSAHLGAALRADLEHDFHASCHDHVDQICAIAWYRCLLGSWVDAPELVDPEAFQIHYTVYHGLLLMHVLLAKACDPRC